MKFFDFIRLKCERMRRAIEWIVPYCSESERRRTCVCVWRSIGGLAKHIYSVVLSDATIFSKNMSNEWAHSFVNDYDWFTVLNWNIGMHDDWNFRCFQKNVKWNKTCLLIQIEIDKNSVQTTKVEKQIFLQEFIWAKWMLLLPLSSKVLYA